jgi:hypothetical protein
MENLADIIKKKVVVADHRNKYEFQAYGNKLAQELNDQKHLSLYIKYAKEKDRALLESALAYAQDNAKPESKARAFMWKLSELGKKTT